MISITAHGKERMMERCKIKARSTDRIAQIAFEKGLTHAETTGSLHKYADSLYLYNRQANNIRLYGGKIYIFCNDVLVTVYDIPKHYLPIVNKLMRRRTTGEITK